jgi:hypothetical protein
MPRRGRSEKGPCPTRRRASRRGAARCNCCLPTLSTKGLSTSIPQPAGGDVASELGARGTGGRRRSSPHRSGFCWSQSEPHCCPDLMTRSSPSWPWDTRASGGPKSLDWGRSRSVVRNYGRSGSCTNSTPASCTAARPRTTRIAPSILRPRSRSSWRGTSAVRNSHPAPATGPGTCSVATESLPASSAFWTEAGRCRPSCRRVDRHRLERAEPAGDCP